MTARPVKEWIGRRPTSMPTVKVFDRLYEAQNGICACGCGVHMNRNRDRIVRDHKIPLKDGGANRETNLQLLLEAHHFDKTSAENTGRAESERWHSKAYVRSTPKMQGRGFDKRPKQHTATRAVRRKSEAGHQIIRETRQ